MNILTRFSAAFHNFLVSLALHNMVIISKDGPSIMNLKALEERLNKIESLQIIRPAAIGPNRKFPLF
jgi:hypothetical protein